MKSNGQGSNWIFLLGPTAVGKSEVAVELALRLGGEIVSADSMQIYRGMDIGTAKPSLEQRRGVPHHLLDVLEIHEACDVARFRDLALTAIRDIQERGARPIVVGGSGLYVRSITQGLFEGPGRDETLRRELEALDAPTLRKRLAEADPSAAARIQPEDRRRMIRALEFFVLTGNPISSRQTQWSGRGQSVHRKATLVGLNRSRAELYRRCDLRVDAMLSNGWVEEVRNLMRQGLSETPTASKAIGYREVMSYVADELPFDRMVELVKQRTRNFVKRQLTWFRREPNIVWLDFAEDDSPKMASRILEQVNAATD